MRVEGLRTPCRGCLTTSVRSEVRERDKSNGRNMRCVWLHESCPRVDTEGREKVCAEANFMRGERARERVRTAISAGTADSSCIEREGERTRGRKTNSGEADRNRVLRATRCTLGVCVCVCVCEGVGGCVCVRACVRVCECVCVSYKFMHSITRNCKLFINAINSMKKCNLFINSINSM